MKEILKNGFAELSISASEKQISQLIRYSELLGDWNTKINLTAICDEKGIAQKHFLDSATALLTDSEKLGGTNGVAYEDTTDLEFTNRKDVSTTSFGTGQNERKDTTTKTFGGSSDSEKRKNITDSSIKGNIGITTSQQMISSQFPVEVADKIEHYTVNEFVHEYLVR